MYKITLALKHSVAAALLLAADFAVADLIDVDNTALEELVSKATPVIDVRTPEEWRKTGVIESSHLLTFFDAKQQYDAPKWLAELSEVIDPKEPFVLICHSGGRTSMIGQWLAKEFETVYHVEDGIVKWIAEDKKVVPFVD